MGGKCKVFGNDYAFDLLIGDWLARQNNSSVFQGNILICSPVGEVVVFVWSSSGTSWMITVIYSFINWSIFNGTMLICDIVYRELINGEVCSEGKFFGDDYVSDLFICDWLTCSNNSVV